VVELTGDFTLTLPVMLAVAIASTVSRMLSYGTIYTTKLLRRGIDVDRAAPWRAFGDLKVSEAMQKLGTPLAVPDGNASEDGGKGPDLTSLPGPVTHQGDPQILFSNESVAQALRQLEVYGNDGLPVLSPDGQQVQGWVTNASVLRSIAHRIDASGSQDRRPSSPPNGRPPARNRPSPSRPPRWPATRSSKSPSPKAPPPPGSRSGRSPGRPDGPRSPYCTTGSWARPTPGWSSAPETTSTCSCPAHRPR
jgi:CIC family chloride channel protein